MNNLNIFICTHKDFPEYPINDSYKIIAGENDNISDKKIEVLREYDNKYSPVQRSMSEVSRIYYIWKNYINTDYIGICHYRRYFSFYDNVDYISWFVNRKYNKNNKSIILLNSEHIHVPSHYNECHNINDYIEVKNIIKNKFNINDYILNKTEYELYKCNMFIMHRNDFENYCAFLFTVLDEFIKVRGFTDMNSIHNYVETNKIYYHSNNTTTTYQERILAFLAERISNIFFKLYFNEFHLLPLVEKNNELYSFNEYFNIP